MATKKIWDEWFVPYFFVVDLLFYFVVCSLSGTQTTRV